MTYLGRKGAIEVNNIFLKLVEGKIEQFENDYINLSRQIFVDNNGKMIHPGAVSYTHLDVYKRQVCWSRESIRYSDIPAVRF